MEMRTKKVKWMLTGAGGPALLIGCMNPTDSKNGTDETVALRSNPDSTGTGNDPSNNM